MKRRIWAENLMLFKECVERSGGVLEVKASYTSNDGDMSLEVTYNVPLLPEMKEKYKKERHIKK